MTTHVNGIDELEQLVGVDLGLSDYLTVTQEMVNLFADATNDHQWIHVDPVRAATGPFGTTIAHGFLTLSLLSTLTQSLLHVDGVAMGINYGFNRVRFMSPVLVGRDIRAGAVLTSLERFDGGAQATLDVSVTIRDAPKPSCVALWLTRYYL